MRKKKKQFIEPCHTNPDKWFIDIPHTGILGKETIAFMVNDIDVAVGICGHCPVRLACKELGMREENLSHGIWGGMLAGERLMEAGWIYEDTIIRTPERMAFRLLGYAKPWLITWKKEDE